MSKKVITIVAGAVVLLGLIVLFVLKGSFLNNSEITSSDDVSSSDSSSDSSDEQKTTDTAKSIVSQMTLRQKIGQMMILDFRSWKASGAAKESSLKSINKEVETIIANYNLGGVILFSENLQETKASVELVHKMQQAAINSGNLPLLISADQEGGIVTRLGEGTSMPGNMALGATNNINYANQAGQIMGKELKAIGINCNHAPSVDVNDNPKNPVINLRSFGSDPDLVSKMGLNFMYGLQSEKVIATAKHFPGHGNTSTDSHTGLPLVNKTLGELQKAELKPFKTLIDNKIGMVMTSHIQFPNIDSTKYKSKKDGKSIFVPATLSKKIITDILRSDLKYDGVILTDAMNMQAISSNFGEVDAAKMAINAGVDIISMPTILRSTSDVKKLDALFDGIEKAVNSGEIPMSRIDESVERIVQLKINYGIVGLKDDKTPLSDKIKTASGIVGSEEHHKVERTIAGDAITVYRNNNGSIPFKAEDNKTVLLMAPFTNEIPSMEFSVKRLISEKKIANIKYTTHCYNKNTNVSDELKKKIDAADYIIMLTESFTTASSGQGNWITQLPKNTIDYVNSSTSKSSGRLVLVSIGVPYDAAYYTKANTILLAYGYVGIDPTGSSQKSYGPNIPAAIEACFGAVTPKGKCPVEIPS